MEAVVGTSRLAAQRETREGAATAAWFHAHGRIWVPFPEVDNIALEEAYGRVQDQLAERRATLSTPPAGAPPARRWFWSARTNDHTSVLPPPPPPAPPDKHALPSYRATDPDEDADERQFRVAVLEDRLFDVDLAQMVVRVGLLRRCTPRYGPATTNLSCAPIGTMSRQTVLHRPLGATRRSKPISCKPTILQNRGVSRSASKGRCPRAEAKKCPYTTCRASWAAPRSTLSRLTRRASLRSRSAAHSFRSCATHTSFAV